MDLVQKLEKLKAQQVQIESQMQEQIEKQNQVALSVLTQFITAKPEAMAAMRNSKFAKDLSKREAALFIQWLERFDPNTSAQAGAQTVVSSGSTQSGLPTTEKDHVSH